MSGAWLLCAVTLVMDSVLFGGVVSGFAPSGTELSALLAVHVAVCLLFSVALVRLLPQPLHGSVLNIRLFVFLSIVFIPVLGMVGLVGLVPVLRRHGLAVRPGGWQYSRIPSLPSKPARPQANGTLSSGSDLAGSLQHAVDPRKRIAALIATLSLEAQQAVPLLRLALKDPDDEVRLLAYALLNRKEKAVEARMRQQQAEPASETPAQAFLRHKALAHDYWELAHLGDPQGDALISLCGRAHEHAQAALQLCPQDGGLHFLNGQILLAQWQLDTASEAFETARQCGLDARQIAAMLAEVAFRRQRYSDVKHHLAQASGGARQFALNKLSSYWAGGHA